MTTPEQVVSEAQNWVRTPYRHQANPGIKGVATDCVGLVRGIASELGLVDNYTGGARYPRVATGQLRQLLEEHMDQVQEIAPGDVVLFGTGRNEHHIGIYDGDGVIHAHERRGFVVATPYRGEFKEQTRGIYRFREFT